MEVKEGFVRTPPLAEMGMKKTFYRSLHAFSFSYLAKKKNPSLSCCSTQKSL